MADRNSMNQIDVCLGLRNISDKEYKRVKNNIREFFNISDFSYFIPHIKLFSNFISNSKTLNNNDKLFKLTSRKKRYGIIGNCFDAKIKSKSNNIYHKKVFVKELSFFQPDQNE